MEHRWPLIAPWRSVEVMELAYWSMKWRSMKMGAFYKAQQKCLQISVGLMSFTVTSAGKHAFAQTKSKHSTRSGVWTHADTYPLDLKSNALTTRPSWWHEIGRVEKAPQRNISEPAVRQTWKGYCVLRDTYDGIAYAAGRGGRVVKAMDC